MRCHSNGVTKLRTYTKEYINNNKNNVQVELISVKFFPFVFNSLWVTFTLRASYASTDKSIVIIDQAYVLQY